MLEYLFWGIPFLLMQVYGYDFILSQEKKKDEVMTGGLEERDYLLWLQLKWVLGGRVGFARKWKGTCVLNRKVEYWVRQIEVLEVEIRKGEVFIFYYFLFFCEAQLSS